MSIMIESMESRVLLTASAGQIESDLFAGQSALATSKADLKAGLLGVAVEVKAFKADVKGLKLTPTQKVALATLEKAVAVDSAKLSGMITKILASGKARGAALEGTLKSLQAHPTSPVIQVKVATALVKLQDVFSASVITNLEGVYTADVAVVDADLTNVAAAIPSTASTASDTESALTGDGTTLTNDVSLIENAITALATDLA